MADDKKNQPMDIGAPEGDAPDMYKPLDRMPYAMEQLVGEMTDLFPDTTYELSNRNQRGVCFDIKFDLGALSEEDLVDARLLFTLMNDEAYNEDPRLEDVILDAHDAAVLVSFRNDPRVMDLRDPFGLAVAWGVMTGQGSATAYVPENLSFPGGFDADKDGPS